MPHDQRLPVRLFNGAHRLMERIGKSKPGLVESEAALREAAVKLAGADDFGADDYLSGLKVLLEAYDEESHLNAFGRVMIDAQLTGIFRNRLVSEKWWRTNPEIRKSKIERPIFILGLPRTGTTALHHVLGQDPAHQSLEYWIAAAARPRPPRETWAATPEYAEAEKGLKTMYWLDPSLRAIHDMRADGPEECRHLLGQCFTDDTFECNSTVPSYSKWYAACDMRPTYRRHRALLQLVGSTSPQRRWLLKYPAHLRHLEALLEVYPDACIVQTHRDPARLLPSLASLVAGWRGIYEDNPDRPAIGAWNLEMWASTMESAMAVRERHDSAQFYDLDFREVVSDPIAAATKIYDHFGLELSDQASASMQAWRAANPPGKHGEHRYTAADFNLTSTKIHDRFAAYLERFGIEREGIA